MENGIRIATFNISGGVAKEGGENYFDQEKSGEIDRTFLDEIIDLIHREKIDIIAFQEIITTEDVGYIGAIAERTDLKFSSAFELSECNLVENTDCGLAIFSRFPIIDEMKVKFTNPNLSITTDSGKTYYSYDKGFLKVKIEFDGKVMDFFTCHFLPFGRFGAKPEEYRGIFGEIEEEMLKSESFMLAGDFNADGIVSLMSGVAERSEKLFGNMEMGGQGKYDNVFISRDYECAGRKIIKSMSDHYLCVADIKMNLR